MKGEEGGGRRHSWDIAKMDGEQRNRHTLYIVGHSVVNSQQLTRRHQGICDHSGAPLCREQMKSPRHSKGMPTEMQTDNRRAQFR